MIPLIWGAAAGYTAAVGALYALQDRLVFPAHATPPPTRPLPAGASHWQIEVAPDTVVRGVHLRPRDGAAQGLVIGFGGNCHNARDLAVHLHECLPERHVVVFHYRGYAPSQGRASEAALCSDAEIVFDETVARLGNAPTVAMGFSLGSGVAAHLAASRPLAGAVLVTPFDSILEVGRQRYWWAPVQRLLKHRFDSRAKLGERSVPVAVLAAGADEVVPPDRTRALLTALARPVFYRSFAGASHRSLYEAPDFEASLRAAVDAVQAAAMPDVTVAPRPHRARASA
ncbi:MAG: alpha/beta hydrolase [Pseudomonadota bacterium]